MKTFDCTDVAVDQPIKLLLPNGMVAQVRTFKHSDSILIDMYEDEAAFEANEPFGGVSS